jgi:hypothetical protein
MVRLVALIVLLTLLVGCARAGFGFGSDSDLTVTLQDMGSRGDNDASGTVDSDGALAADALAADASAADGGVSDLPLDMAPYYTVTKPTRGAVVLRGTTMKIEWTGGGPKDAVRIQLYQRASGQLRYILRIVPDFTSNDGEHDWFVSSATTPATNYLIRVSIFGAGSYQEGYSESFEIR